MKVIDEKLLMEELDKLKEDYASTQKKIATLENEKSNEIANKNALYGAMQQVTRLIAIHKEGNKSRARETSEVK
tara:strand:+ start:4136 stop:4357 length:222 start_codon:yes stop_codon:yes gene_type:complete